MRTAIYVGGLVTIWGVCILGYLRASRQRSEHELVALASTVPAPLTDDVRRWLAPQLRRRTVYPFVGWMTGMGIGNHLGSDWQTIPWYWFAILVGGGAGGTIGALIASCRMTPLVDGPARTVDAAPRRLRDFLTPPQVLSLRLAVAVSVAAAALAVTVSTSTAATSAQRALLGCGLGAALVVADYWVAARAVSRPMVTSTPEGLLWQRALVARTVGSTPAGAFLVAAFGAAVALYVTVLSYDELPAAVLALAVVLALLVAASVGMLVSHRWRSPGPEGAPFEHARP